MVTKLNLSSQWPATFLVTSISLKTTMKICQMKQKLKSLAVLIFLATPLLSTLVLRGNLHLHNLKTHLLSKMRLTARLANLKGTILLTTKDLTQLEDNWKKIRLLSSWTLMLTKASWPRKVLSVSRIQFSSLAQTTSFRWLWKTELGHQTAKAPTNCLPWRTARGSCSQEEWNLSLSRRIMKLIISSTSGQTTCTHNINKREIWLTEVPIRTSLLNCKVLLLIYKD